MVLHPRVGIGTNADTPYHIRSASNPTLRLPQENSQDGYLDIIGLQE